MCFELLLAFFLREGSESDKAPFYYQYDSKKEKYSLLVNSSLPKQFQSYISEEWNFNPGILQDGHGRYPMFKGENIGVFQLLIVYSSLLYEHGIEILGMDKIDLQDTISDFKRIIRLFKAIK